MIKKYSYNNDKDTFLTPHFQVGEFRSYSDDWGRLTTDDILIDENLPIILEKIFEALNCSLIHVTSGYRSNDFDEAIGGFLGYHSKGQAADIICYAQDGSVIDPKNVCITAENLGILGIGYGGSYTHIDTRDWKSFFDETNGAVNIASWYDYFGIARPVAPTPEPKPEPVHEPTPDVNENTYTVAEGDCLSVIGERLGLNWQEIAQINGICEPYIIYPGQVLKLPNGTQNNEIWYTVVEGDCLSIIANNFGVDMQQIINFNNIENPDLIYPGQSLRIR